MINVYIGDLLLPINPSELFIKKVSGNKTVDIMNFGTMSLPFFPKLTEVKISSFFPSTPYTFANSLDTSPKSCVEYLENILHNGHIIPFWISGGLKELRMDVTIDSFFYGEKGGDIDDIFFDITLKEFRKSEPITVDSSSFQKRPPLQLTPPPSAPPYRTYTVKKGDSLWNISKKYLGDARRYPEIAKLNHIPNPRLIYPGQVFKLPW